MVAPLQWHWTAAYRAAALVINRSRRAPSPALDALRQAGSVQSQLGGDPIRALHPVISSLYTQFSALCLRLDERLETLEQRVLHKADDQELAEITAIRHRAAVIRRTVTPGRDLAARMPLILSLPGTTSDTQLYADDINDELQQVVADLTVIGERCVALLALHASLATSVPAARRGTERRLHRGDRLRPYPSQMELRSADTGWTCACTGQ
jgi:Mg2+ and Co2+ transporter CorA